MFIVSPMSSWQHLVIPDPSGTRVLLVPDGAGWMLPRVPNADWMMVEAAQSWVREHLGLDIAILRCAQVESGGGGQEEDHAFLFAEDLGGADPRAGSWWDEEAASTAATDEGDRAALRRWFTEAREGRPGALRPWEYPGWFASASAWIEASLPGVLSVTQYATWSVSSVLRVQTEAGRYYFKAAPPHFRHEAAVTKALAEWFPSTIPLPVAIDAERGWFLTEDFGDQLVGDEGELYAEGIIDTLVGIQRASAVSLGSLLRSGCLDRRPPMLRQHVEELAAGGSDWLQGPTGRRLREALPRFRELCEQVAGSSVPDTLVHGDFHGDNVAERDGRYLIFDWTDACIAHPFFDTAIILREVDRSGDPALGRRWRERYLEAWRDVVDPEDAADLLELTEPLGAMHQAISYRWLLDSMDPGERWQFGSALEDWVMRALTSRVLTS